ncbi:putative LRR receptor-like serine/threonine-protein kinase At1g53440 [Apium graveolens]|uniref:putative LRR receptor-like serine/threonine-protein kinase At1g53440 n=1 Tax=Apium graveolens TaxID=4045 RepID=UPI003D78F80D
MTRLRISDLTGRNSTIPDLKDMQSLHVLILRNCLINGALPEYFGVLGQLKTLYLNHNSLTGEIPSWISGSKENFDVSYNNFSWRAEYNCQPSNVVAWCVKKDLPCSRKPQCKCNNNLTLQL